MDLQVSVDDVPHVGGRENQMLPQIRLHQIKTKTNLTTAPLLMIDLMMPDQIISTSAPQINSKLHIGIQRGLQWIPLVASPSCSM